MIFSRQALVLLLPLWVSSSGAFSVAPPAHAVVRSNPAHASTALFISDEEKQELNESFNELTEDEKKEAVGNLVADDEWQGLGMELTELVRVAVLEDVKGNTRDFIGKEDYKVGDITKEIDDRVKGEVAKMRSKEEYELGDLFMALDELSKIKTEELTGKDYQPGDLSTHLKERVKEKMAQFAGKESHEDYELGDVTKEITSRVNTRVEEFTGKPYEFGDVTMEIRSRRQAWVKDYLGAEAFDNYQFGDVTKKALSDFTGKDDYQFGDVSKKIMGDLFGKRKTGGK